MMVKAVVWGDFLHAERRSNLRLFFGVSKFHLCGMSCDDGCINFPAILKFENFIGAFVSEFLSGVGVDVAHHEVDLPLRILSKLLPFGMIRRISSWLFSQLPFW